ncbi:MAG: metallophosphoesterase family protein [Lachnospiraceae bacterium]|nr:metallophosphoesterase family protein [Lachnospiraceae bacterium]
MKIIHCADIHLDSPMASLPKEIAAKRREELLLAFRHMVEYAHANYINTILISGDLFDRKKPSATAVNTVTGLIATYRDINFYYLRGNHDCGELYDDESIPDNLIMFNEDWSRLCIADKSDGAGCDIVVCGIEPASTNKELCNHVPALDMNAFNIVMLHGEAGENADISLRSLRGCGIDYLALGHIHSHKYAELDKRGAYCYPGCLEARGFDECGEHGFVVLDIDRITRTHSIKLISSPIRAIHKLELDISDCADSTDIFEAARRLVEDNVKSSDEMFLLELVGSTDIGCDRNNHMLEQYFDNNYYLARVHDSSEYRVDYDDYALDESLKGEFVRLVKADLSLSEEDKAAIIRLGIKALRGEEIG